MNHDFRFCLGIVTTHLTHQWKNSITELALYNAYLIMHFFV